MSVPTPMFVPSPGMSEFRSIIRRGPWDQYGEDSILRWMLDDKMGGPKYRRCAEFGAGDGLDCAVTLALWRNDGWEADLIEADHERYGHLRRFVASACDGTVTFEERSGVERYTHERTDGRPVTTVNTALTVATVNGVICGDYDVVSIDVDGPDFHLWEALECRPRIVVIERNQSIPWWLDIRQENEGARFGASARALFKLAIRKGYTFVGATGANMFFVRDEDAEPFMDAPGFDDMMREYERHESWMTYAVTDYDGRMVPIPVGSNPFPWGFAWEPCETPLLMDQS